MIDLIVFSVSENRYAINIENVQRIIQAQELTNIPNAHSYIDGMMSYEDKVIKVVNFRKLIGIESYHEELSKLFAKLKGGHQEWIDDLRHSVENGVPFTKTIDPHACELGLWLDKFNSYDDKVSQTLKDLMQNHKQLHSSGGDALDLMNDNPSAASEMVNTTIYDTFKHTMSDIDTFIAELDTVANSLQKLIIYDNDGVVFSIKVDKIEDIAHIQESEFINAGDDHDTNDFLELEGVLDLQGVLINVIKTVVLPK